MQRRDTKIPRPLASVSENEPVAAKAGTKRKAPSCSELETVPEAKKGKVEVDSWEHIAESQGWTSVEECLAQRLTFKKRETAGAVKEKMLEHVKHLRAAGNHLNLENKRLAMDLGGMQAALGSEEEARRGDAAKAAAGEKRLKEELQALQASKAELEASASAAQERMQLALSKQVASTTSLQQYCTQLQDYNNKLQADVREQAQLLATLQSTRLEQVEALASLKGQVSSLSEQAQSAQSAKERAEQERATAQASTAQLASALEETRQLLRRAEEVAREASRDAEVLRAERSQLGELQNRSVAQVQAASQLMEALAAAKKDGDLKQALADASEACAQRCARDVEKLQEELTAVRDTLRACEAQRRHLHNTVLELKGNIRVFCRVRPSQSASQPAVTYCQDAEGQGLSLASPDLPAATFFFDNVFQPAASQEEVYGEVAHLVQSALDGYNVCIFAYGQTGSGKTHTVLGSPSEAGLVPRALQQLFAEAARLEESGGWTFTLKMSLVEIYNEEFRDLLGPGPPAGKKHTLAHDPSGKASLTYVDVVTCQSSAQCEALVAKAVKLRSTEATSSNAQSSRSHAVFTLSVSGVRSAGPGGKGGAGQRVEGQLNFVDLGGSERVKVSGAEGARMKEAQAINKSLSALGDVIAALGRKEDAHIPYRNSKLTSLLQTSLKRNSAKVLMVVNLAPEVTAAGESLCALRFASKVRATQLGTARAQQCLSV